MVSRPAYEIAASMVRLVGREQVIRAHAAKVTMQRDSGGHTPHLRRCSS
jgi:hypothetical protein